MKFYGGAGNSAPSGALAQIGYDGQTQVFGAQLSYPLVRLREQSLNLLANFDAIQSNVLNNLGPNGAAQRSSYDSPRILRLGADYAVLDTLLGPERGGLNGFSGRVGRGLGMLGASHNGDTTRRRRGWARTSPSPSSTARRRAPRRCSVPMPMRPSPRRSTSPGSTVTTSYPQPRSSTSAVPPSTAAITMARSAATKA